MSRPPPTLNPMFTVTGTLTDGRPYDLTIGGEPAGEDTGWGEVSAGTPNVIALLRSLEGEHVRATHSSASAVLDPDDAASILTALYDRTRVRSVAGEDVPAVGAAGLDLPDDAVH